MQKKSVVFMKPAAIFIFIIIAILHSGNSFAFSSNGTNYRIVATTVSSGGKTLNSTTYSNVVGAGVISGILNSSNFINKIGFLYQILFANGQPCTSDNQCEGGYCCSNLCRSTSCPSGAQEAGVSGGGAAGAAAGGGGGGPPPIIAVLKEEEVKDFKVSPKSLKFSLNLGDTKKQAITVENTGTVPLEIGTDIEEVGSFISLSDTSFVIEKQSSKEVEAAALGRNLGTFFGEITFTGAGIKKSVPVVLEIESSQVLFDAKLDIPSKFKKVAPGSDLKVQITLLNVGAPKNVDVTVTYLIKGKGGEIIHESSETFAVEKQKSYLKSIAIPKALKEGSYLAAIEVRYADSFAVSSEMFEVVSAAATANIVNNLSGIAINNINYVLIAVISLLSGIIYILYRKAKVPKNSR